MKDLAQLLGEISPSTPTAASLISSTAPGAISLSDVDEAMLARIFRQHKPTPPTDFNLIFRFCCLGLGAFALTLGGLIAYWHRPVEAMAQAETIRSMGSALVVAQQQNQAMAIAANPPKYSCFALQCRFPDKESERQIQQATTPSQPIPAQPVALPMPPMPAPIAPEEMERATVAIADWQRQGFDRPGVGQFVAWVRANPGPDYPQPEALEIAYANIYGAD